MSALDIASVVAIGAVGLALGSFLNVIVDRLPVLRTEPDEMGSMYESRPWSEVLGGRSRCSECGTALGARDLVPVVSWAVLRGRCRTCGARIGAFHLVVEVAVPVLLILTWAIVGWTWDFAIIASFVLMAVPLAAIDIRTYTLPKALVWPGTGLVVAVTLVAAVASADMAMVLQAIIGSATVTLPLFLLWFIHPSGQGFGDVRLAVVLGWVVGATSQGDSLLNACFRGWICLLIAAAVGLVGAIPMAMARGLKARIPFGPFLVIGALVCSIGAEWIGV